MNHWTLNYGLGIIISVVLAGLIIPNIIHIAFRHNLFDEVDERKIHRGVVPRLGGIAFLPALIFSFCLVMGCNLRLNADGVNLMVAHSVVAVFFLVCALMLMYLVGIADDLIGVRYHAKFIFQIIAGLLIVLSGCWIKNLEGFLWIHEWPAVCGWILSVFLIIAIVNSINLIDGIDGLASGLSVIALAFYSFIFFMAGRYAYALLAGCTLGTLLPFFYFNVFGSSERHNKIFMGDTGSLTIGTILGFLCIEMFELPESGVPNGENLFVLAMAPILVPCFDVARVFLHRIRRGCNPFLPDKSHIHHKLLALGMVQWQALITILIVDASFILLNLLISPYLNPTFILAADGAIWILLHILLTRMIRKREKKLGCTLYV